MPVNSKLTGSVLLALAALSLEAGTASAAVLAVQKPYVVKGAAVLVQMSVDAAQARLAQALQALEAAQASGGDVAGAQAEVSAAQAELNAAMAASAPEPAPEPEPAPAPAPVEEPQPQQEQPPVAEPTPEPAPEPAPEPVPQAVPAPAPAPEPAPAVEEPAATPDQAVEPPAEAPADQPEPQAAEPSPAEQAPAEPAPAETVVPEKQPAPQTAEPPPEPAEPPVPESAPVPAEQPQERPLPDAGPVPTPADESKAPAAEAPEAAPSGAAQPDAQVEAPSMTQEELEKAKAIAENPAESTETVILPVDKGAAVLDSDKEVDLGSPAIRETRRREREAVGEVKVPETDAEAQAAIAGQQQTPVKIEAATAVEGKRIARQPRFERPEGVEERARVENRIIIQFGDRIVVRNDDSNRFMREAEEQYFEQLPEGRVRETIIREDGTRVVTIRNRYGEIIQRSRIDERGREYVLFYAPELIEAPQYTPYYRDPGLDLPPMRLGIPVRDYIIDTSSDPDRDYYQFLEQPPVEQVERVYSLDEVKYSARIRDKVRRIDLDTITFSTGSAEISMNQAKSLRRVADAIGQILDENPAETFLIEGHTDAVGSDQSNLILSDERAESVANVLTDVFGIPPENLVTQGYGERYLKVRTLAAEQQNRRVTIRRVTALVRPVAANQ